VRINREEKEKGRTTDETVASLKRRVGMVFGGGREPELELERTGVGKSAA
jgi:hypothetical protein